ncbi:hypothetical protein WG66_016074 [Moniliophthora roreri]|nr:hypothetical protein WG66_016074 [Moniliophthora roreri]
MGLERPRQSLNTLQLVSKRRSAASDVISGPVAENKAVTDVSSQLRRTSVSLSSPPLKPLKEEVGRCAIVRQRQIIRNHLYRPLPVLSHSYDVPGAQGGFNICSTYVCMGMKGQTRPEPAIRSVWGKHGIGEKDVSSACVVVVVH